MLARHPERVIEIAVKGMLPKNPLGRAMFKKLKVYAGAEHPHTAQQPQALEDLESATACRLMATATEYGTGRRKTSAARVFLRKGSGNITVNGKPLDEFFGRETSRMIVRQPLELTQNADKFDMHGDRRRRRHHRPGRRDPPRHHARAGRIRRDA